MKPKVIAIVGSYRKGGITDQAVDAVMAGAASGGAAVRKIHLMDQKIEFCTNCRTCAHDDPSKIRGRCVIGDDVDKIFSWIDESDGLVLAAPVNFWSPTAVMKKFIERMVAYGYWPWTARAPKNRIRRLTKKAVVITSSACPAVFARFLMPDPLKLMKQCSNLLGAKVVDSIYFGGVCLEEKQKLDARQLERARRAGLRLG